jgi:hypothetical protein
MFKTIILEVYLVYEGVGDDYIDDFDYGTFIYLIYFDEYY